MLRCRDQSYYVGHTDDLGRRLEQHAGGSGALYTSQRLPVELVWSGEFADREDAKLAEIRIKSWSRRKKEALIAGDDSALREAARKQDWAGYRQRRRADEP